MSNSLAARTTFSADPATTRRTESIHQRHKLLQIRNELEALAPRTAGYPQNPLLDSDTLKHD